MSYNFWLFGCIFQTKKIKKKGIKTLFYMI